MDRLVVIIVIGIVMIMLIMDNPAQGMYQPAHWTGWLSDWASMLGTLRVDIIMMLIIMIIMTTIIMMIIIHNRLEHGIMPDGKLGTTVATNDNDYSAFYQETGAGRCCFGL